MRISVLMSLSMGLATRSVAGSSIVAISQTSPSDVALGDEATDPVAPNDADGAPTDRAALREDGAPRPLDDAHPESVEAADEEDGRRSFFARIGGRAVVVPLACVAAFLVGFGSVAAVLRLTDEPGPDAKPAPTTAPPAASAPAAAPGITTPLTSAARAPAAQSEPPPPAPEAAPAPASAPPAGASESPPPPSSSPTTVPTTTPSTTTP